MSQKITINLELTTRETELLRVAVSDLGTDDKDCVRLQLKIANAILDATEVDKKSDKK